MSKLLFLACVLGGTCALLGACPGTADKNAGRPTTASSQRDVAGAGAENRGMPPKAAEIAPTEIEPEFIYCCGNATYKLEIDCSAGLMRCYEHRGDAWHYTYGRHCKKNLGQVCYLTGCDDKCD